MDYGINFSYEDNKQLKEIYKELLKKNGLTMLEASKLLGLSTPQQLNNKFNNKKISLSDLKNFLSIMGYDYEITIKKRSGNVYVIPDLFLIISYNFCNSIKQTIEFFCTTEIIRQLSERFCVGNFKLYKCAI